MDANALSAVDNVHLCMCPHCGVAVVVVDIACGIFRCGELKNGQGQIPSHADRAMCDKLVREGLVWGCAKPFRFDGRVATACDYI